MTFQLFNLATHPLSSPFHPKSLFPRRKDFKCSKALQNFSLVEKEMAEELASAEREQHARTEQVTNTAGNTNQFLKNNQPELEVGGIHVPTFKGLNNYEATP